MSTPSAAIGLVLRVDAKVCHVDVEGRTLQVPLRGRLFEERGHEKNPVAAGDRVRLDFGEEGGAITEVLPRRSKLARRAKGDEAREQVIAANVSLVLVVASVRDPPFTPLLVDRILAGAARQDIAAALVVTKVDRDSRGDAAAWADLYRGLGYEVFTTSVLRGKETTAELERLRARIAREISVLSGPSGAGKSSLINWLVPGLGLRIGNISRIRQGKHTTSHSQLVPLPFGGWVLDTPGIRNFMLFGAATQEVTFYFPEIRARAPSCAYRNCTHVAEPECAVRTAAERGEIAASRYESYLRIVEELSLPEW